MWRQFPAFLILLVAAGLRLYGLNNVSPPGLEHDEVAHWLISQDILAGRHAVYFTEAYGHEAGFHYFQTLFLALLGDNALALRLPAAFCGLLGVAVTFALTRRLFGRRVALLAAAWLAVVFWPVFYGRLGLRAISLPLVSGLSAYFWWWGWQGAGGRGQVSRFTFHVSRCSVAFGLAGLFAGLSLYTYMAGRAVPIFYGLYVVYLFLRQRPVFKRHWRYIALFGLVFLAVALPLALYLYSHPGAEYRIGEVDAPLRALLAGDWRPALTNGLKILSGFGWQGDPLWRQNVAGRPVFEPVTAVLFYGGLLLSLWRWRDERYAFLLLWLVTSTLPSVLTIDAPSSIRLINALPVVTVFPSLVIHSLMDLSTAFPGLSTRRRAGMRGLGDGVAGGRWQVAGGKSTRRRAGMGGLGDGEVGGKSKIVYLAAVVLLVVHVGRTVDYVFRLWPANEEVQFVWQEALTEAAAYLDASPDNGPVAIGGWTPETMDPPTMELTLRRDDLSLRYFNPMRTIIVPAVDPGGQARLVRPTVLPLDPLLEAEVATWSAAVENQGSFTLYAIPFPPPIRPQVSASLPFGDQLTLLGYTQPSTFNLQPSTFNLITFWRVERPAGGPRRFFLHLVNEQGDVVAQDDSLEAPAAFWRPGDVIVQRHSLIMPASGAIRLRLGVYDPVSGERLRTAAGLDYVELVSRE